ncbi:MAG: 50S ribosomal protein L25/general stress protein Ctc [Burkholderiales bacterium]|nr:50S ribosomal protein L25/general stress protein Ctc [Burkholderiales bacterium]
MQIEVNAQKRTKQGTGASRRLRREGKTPGVVYGGKEPAVVIELDHNALYHQLRQEAFHASVLMLNLEGTKEQVLLRAVNMHPFRPEVQHVDFQRVQTDVNIQMKVPLHFVNAEISPGVKLSGGIVSHVMSELAIRCLPADLPEFIEVDLKDLAIGNIVHVKDLQLPKGVEAILHGSENPPVAVVQIPRAMVADEAADAAAAEAAVSAAEVPTSKQAEPAAAEKGGEKGGEKGEKKSEKSDKK